MSTHERILGTLLGPKVANSETRHKPPWWPSSDLDVRLFDERLAVLTIPPHKPPYRRHVCLKMWLDTEPLHRVAILELDWDERTIDLNIYD